MVDSVVPSERRRTLRVPARGVAVLYASDGPLHGTVENLSMGGALISVTSRPREPELDIEVRIAEGNGWVKARTVRVEPSARTRNGTVDVAWRIAVAFDLVDDSLRQAIDAAIDGARGAAQRRPILVIDENSARKRDLVTRLSDRGMTPLVPRTPLEAIDLLSRPQLHVGVCLLAPGLGLPSNDLRAVLSDSFPWVSVAEITDDLDATTHQALHTWSTTPIARLATAA